jgi:hypothetical protein
MGGSMEQGGQQGKIGRLPLLSRVQREEFFEEIPEGEQKGTEDRGGNRRPHREGTRSFDRPNDTPADHVRRRPD